MKIENCPKCGGDHWGSYTCPFSDEDIRKMKALPGEPGFVPQPGEFGAAQPADPTRVDRSTVRRGKVGIWK